MAIGLLGTANPNPNLLFNIYTVPNNVTASLNISVVNMGITDANVIIYISDNTTTTADRLLESNATIPANGGVLERQGVLCSSGERLYIQSSSSNTSFRVHGFED